MGKLGISGKQTKHALNAQEAADIYRLNLKS